MYVDQTTQKHNPGTNISKTSIILIIILAGL